MRTRLLGSFLIALAAGGFAAWGVDLSEGRARRQWLRKRVLKGLSRLDEAWGKAVRDAGNRLAGEVAVWERPLRSPPVSDDKLEARVRAELGRLVHHPHSVRVTARGGTIVLSGAAEPREIGAVYRHLKTVRGVVRVIGGLQPRRYPASGRRFRARGRVPPSVQLGFAALAAGGGILSVRARREPTGRNHETA